MIDRMSFDYWKSQLDEQWLEAIAFVHRGKDIERGITEAFGDLISQPDRLERADTSDFKKLVNSWLANQRRAKVAPVVKKFTLDDLQ